MLRGLVIVVVVVAVLGLTGAFFVINEAEQRMAG